MVSDLRKLSRDEIEKLASRQGVKRIAVENFLMTVTNNESIVFALGNLYNDAVSYKWNKPTIGAIAEGIAISAGVPEVE